MSRFRHGHELRISFFAFQDIITAVTGILVLVTLMMTFSLHDDNGSPENQNLEKKLQTARARATEIESQNQKMQQRRLEASTLPSAMQIQAQVESLRREQEQSREQRQRSEQEIIAAQTHLSQSKPLPVVRAEVAALEKEIHDLREQLKTERTNNNVLFIVPAAAAQQSQKHPAAFVVGREKLSAQRLAPGARTEVTDASENSFRELLSEFKPQEDLLVLYFRPSGAKWFESFRELARARGFEVGYDAVEENKELVFSPP